MKKTILPSIYYVGVNDRKTALFESLWTLPLGVSYNAYVIRDQKNVLIDTVEVGFSDVFLDKLQEVLDGETLDYLVVNHLEPDHSGSLTKIRALYPQVQVVGNTKTMAMLQSFYGPLAHSRTIQDGESLSLGQHTLTFHLTPMVHWPETMMTYETTTATLFSGDAFGCFGALNGGIVDREMHTEAYFPEMRRYYSAIVGKYGVTVQNALKKLAGVKINTICPTHGPIWREQIAHVVKCYDTYSKYQAEPGVTIAYGSMYGHTATTADKIALALADKGVKNIAVFDVARVDKSFPLSSVFQYNTLLVGSPAYNTELFPPVRAFLDMIQERGVKDRFFASFGDYSWAKVAFRQFDAFVTAMGWTPLGYALYQKSNEPQEVSAEVIDALAGAVVANL